MRPILWALSLWTLLGVVTTPAQAEVSLKSGAYYLGFNDLSYQGGFPVELERTYNSKASVRGRFGWGWGSNLEIRLQIEPDGNLLLEEYGGGARNRFFPTDLTPEKIEADITQISDQQVQYGSLNSKPAILAYQAKLRIDMDFRAAEWARMVQLGRIPAREPKEGTRFRSAQFPDEWIEFQRGGTFARHAKEGRVDLFDARGRLTRITLKSGHFAELGYTPEGHLAKLIDHLHRKILFTTNTDGLITRVDGESGVFAEYRYNPQGELVSSRDTRGNVYAYQYDTAGRHNLIELRFPDQTTEAIAYHEPRAADVLSEGVKTLKLQNGEVHAYEYVRDPKDPDHPSVILTLQDTVGKKLSTTRHEYFYKRKPDGTPWLYRHIEDRTEGSSQQRTESTLNECCGMPLSIRRGNAQPEETSFDYDARGNLVRKITTQAVLEYTYDPGLQKVTRVTRYPKGAAKPKSKPVYWAEFRYDRRGNILFARNSEKRGVRVFYNPENQAVAIMDQRRRRLLLRYDETRKPVEIRDPRNGVVRIQYWNNGKIRKVEGSGGMEAAVEIYSFYESMMELLRSAQPSLSFE